MNPELKHRLIEHLNKTRANTRDHRLLAQELETRYHHAAFGDVANKESKQRHDQKLAELHHKSADLYGAHEDELAALIKFLNELEPTGKAAGFALPEEAGELQKSQVSGIVPNGFRMVTRAGQQLPSATVDPEFEKMVSIEE